MIGSGILPEVRQRDCKTVYTSSILVVASSKFNDLEKNSKVAFLSSAFRQEFQSAPVRNIEAPDRSSTLVIHDRP